MSSAHFSRLAPRLLSLALPLALVACGHGKDAAERQFDEMRTQITKLQADQDRFGERLGALEAQETKREDAAPRPQAAAGDVDQRPKLKVVRVRPDGEPDDDPGPDVDAPDSPGQEPRPVIRASGRGGTLDDAASKGAATADAKRDYEAALSLVKGKQYDKAIEAFAGFLVKYPDHPHADNAMYWRGECFYAKGDYARSADQFEGLVSRFPKGNKVPDALLKLGFSYQRQGAKDKAGEVFARLKAQYPKSDAARSVPRGEP